ncbi:MAG: CHAT domain-containing tetratricopeptide repeat protein, partial [bacterium]
CNAAFTAFNHRFFDVDQIILIKCNMLREDSEDAAPYPGTNAIDYGPECYEYDDFTPKAEQTIRSIFGPESYSIRNGIFYNILGKINFQNNKFAAAENWFTQALQDAERENHSESKLESYHYLGLIQEIRGSYEDAVSFQKCAVELIEKTRGDLINLNARLRYLSVRTDAYEALIRNYYAMYQKDARETYLYHALYFAEKIKTRVLGDRILRPDDSCRKMEIAEFEDPDGWYRSMSENIGHDSCWLNYFVGKSDLFVFVMMPKSLIIRRITIRPDLQDKIKNFLVVLSSRKTSIEFVRKAGSIIYLHLFKPIEDLLLPEIKTLVIIPDGYLSFIPFETLVDAEGKYLLERYNITYELSVNLMSNLSGKKEKQSAQNILAFNYPKKVNVTKTIEKDWKYLRSGKGIAQEQRAVMQFPALKYTKRELDHIKSLMKDRPFFEYVSGEATETAFKKLDSSSIGILHITAHLYYDQEDWRKSFIILHPDEKNGEDGFLQPGEIVGLNLDCGLVVIATCKSGLGKTIKGEGFIGFIDAFHAAGVRSVVSSLWDLDDRFSSDFMKSFYSHIADGRDAGEALRLTKIRMLNSDFSHPCYWGSLVLYGDPNAILN